MTVHFLTGKLGSGKSLCAVGRIHEYLQSGRRIATNLDLFLDGLVAPQSKCNVVRLPDYPRLEDFEILGYGCEFANVRKIDESKYGLIVLDELAMQFNTRAWRASERIDLINWFRHARKLRWDIIFLAQDIESVDGQLVNALCEHFVQCRRLDQFPIPYLGWLINIAGFNTILPKVHIATIYYSQSAISEFKKGRWWYRGTHLYSCYDTEQKFSDGMITLNGQPYDSRATYSLLPPYYTSGYATIDILERRIECMRALQNVAVKPSSSVIVKRKKGSKPDISQPFTSKYREFLVPVLALLISIVLIYYHSLQQTNELSKSSVIALFSGPKTDNLKPIEKKQDAVLPVKNNVVSDSSNEKFDYIHTVLESTYVVVSSMIRDGNKILSLNIKARDENNDLVRYLSYDNLKLMGYAVILTSSGIEVIRGSYHKPVPFS